MVTPEVQRLVDGMVDAAVVIDRERRVLHYNPMMAQLVGGSRRALAHRVAEGVRCFDLMPLEVCERECVGCRAGEVGATVRVDGVRSRGNDAEEQELIVSATPLDDGLVVETYRDVTAEVRVQRRYQEAIRAERDQKEELAKAVAERTRDLAHANEELKRAQAHLVQQEKMSSLGLLVAGVAHEINNPLNFIVCNLPFLEEYTQALEAMCDFQAQLVPDGDKGKLRARAEDLDLEYRRGDAPQLLGAIRKGVERATAIVADLRSFSRGGDGNPGPVDLREGLRSTINLVAPLLKNRVKLEQDLQPVPTVEGHANQLNQVFMNLISNAIQAIPGDDGLVTVRTESDAEWVRVVVKDNGTGIPPEHLARIFDPFFTTKAPGKGTGLGLSISYGIVERHGGRLLVESTPGAGATFTVRLPRTRER